MAVELEEGESYSAEIVYHVNENDLKKIFREELDKAMASITERVEEYVVSHIRAQNFKSDRL